MDYVQVVALVSEFADWSAWWWWCIQGMVQVVGNIYVMEVNQV